MACNNSSNVPAASGQSGIIAPMQLKIISEVSPPPGFVLVEGDKHGGRQQPVLGTAIEGVPEDSSNVCLNISSSETYLEDQVGRLVDDMESKIQVVSEIVQNNKNEVSEIKK